MKQQCGTPGFEAAYLVKACKRIAKSRLLRGEGFKMVEGRTVEIRGDYSFLRHNLVKGGSERCKGKTS